MMPEDVEACVSSVLDDNPDMDESRAYAICNAQKNKGNLEDFDASACGEGQVEINGDCVDIKDVEGVPPSSLDMNDIDGNVVDFGGIFLSLKDDPSGKTIERVEQEDGSVRYTNIRLIAPGVWTDNGSRETIWYSPRGLENLEIAEDNTLNIMHDLDSDGNVHGPSDIGQIDPESKQIGEDGSIYADLVLHRNNNGSRYADENLQSTLQNQGVVGIGGPSVEIDAEGQRIETNAEKGMPELMEGIISGAGVVWNPASKTVDFQRETASRQVALSDGDNAKGIYLKDGSMSDIELMDMTEEEAQALADALGVSVDELMNAMQTVGGEEEEEEPPEEEAPEEGEEEMGDYEDDEEEEEDTEMQGDAMEVIQEQIDDIWGTIEEIKEEMMSGEEMSEELEEARGELADADTVSELQEANEELSKRLAELEDEPKDPKTLSDGSDDGDWWNAEGVVEPSTNSLR